VGISTVASASAHSDRVCLCSTKIEHRLKLQSSYEHHLVADGRPEITTCHSRTALTVDYILYSPGTDTHTLKCFSQLLSLRIYYIYIIAHLCFICASDLKRV